MSRARIPTWLFFVCSGALCFVAFLMFATAVSTASLHFGHCGPSSLSAPEQYCRGASQLLIASYIVLLVSVVFAGAAIWLRIKRRGRL
jgi:hypothetical protein